MNYRYYIYLDSGSYVQIGIAQHREKPMHFFGKWDCRFVMTNTHFFGPFLILHSVPYVLSRSILLKVLDFWGGTWEVHIDINFDILKDNLHYCNKSRDIIMILGFHLFRSLNVSFCSAMQNLSPLFYHLDYIFFLGLWEHV